MLAVPTGGNLLPLGECSAPWATFDLGSISDFLYVHLLHWLEALSLLRKLPEAVHGLRDLELLTVSNGFGACLGLY
jgi:hypothetical protein